MRASVTELPTQGSPTPNDRSFHAFAPRPPLGWNSWDCFATTVTEAQVLANAEYMARRLARLGWQYVVVDIQWYEPGATGYAYRSGAPVVLDEWGRLLPAENRFPSARGGAGFAPLGRAVHELGLKFGIHWMRGIPRLAVERNLPVKGTRVRARDIANTEDTCAWNPDMYGVDMTKPGAQAYYDSVFELFASWGVDYVKVDDISRPYHQRAPEVEAVRRAIDRTGRAMVLSLSPGATALSAADHVKRHANLWRISDDFWDDWSLLFDQFALLEAWNPHRGPGHWPDADMLPLGVLALGERTSLLTPDEQRTLVTLWCIARSPLMHGGDMAKMDAFTESLLTNPEVLAVNQDSQANHPLFRRGDFSAWCATEPSSGDAYVALFNLGDRTPLVPESAAFSTVLRPSDAGPADLGPPGTPVDVDLGGATKLYLVLDDGKGSNRGHHFGVWGNPALVLATGERLDLCDLTPVRATSRWGRIFHDQSPSGEPVVMAGAPCRAALGAHIKSIIEYDLPPDAVRFEALAGYADGCVPLDPEERTRFMVFALSDAARRPDPDAAVTFRFEELGWSGKALVRDLWQQRNLGAFDDAITLRLPWHGCTLLRLAKA